MSTSPEKPWSDDHNAPQIPYWLYLAEKGDFAGFFIGIIAYGIAIALFFRCLGALLDPGNHTGRGMKWALVAHTVAMFSFLTIPVVIDLSSLSFCYINDREFTGGDGILPGPFGCSYLGPKAIGIIQMAMFPLNQWLADGLLLYRCWTIYFTNHWVMAFPCLMYLASVVTGIAYIYVESGVKSDTIAASYFGTSYYSTSLALNVLLTLVIVIRLGMHIRNLRKSLGASEESRGLYTAATTVITMLIESYALYAVVFLAFIVPWGVNSWVLLIFSKPLGVIQVIAPYLIILRVANRRALALASSDRISGSIGSIRFRSEGSMDGDARTLPDGDPMDSMGMGGGAPSELSAARAENAIEEEAPL